MKKDEIGKKYFEQDISAETWDSKHRYVRKEGGKVYAEATIYDTFKRVADGIFPDKKQKMPFDKVSLNKRLLTMMEDGKFMFGGRVMKATGTKLDVSPINCTVMSMIPDSMLGIMDVLKESAITLKKGSGVGYDFSTIRPKGALVAGVGAGTSGPLSFMEIYDKMCYTIQSAGGRRGAQMGIMDCHHPDIEEFISAKRKPNMFRNFNLSILATDDFMQAVENHNPWDLWFWEKTDLDSDLIPDAVHIPKDKTPYNTGGEYFRFKSDHIECIYGNAKTTTVYRKVVYKTFKDANELWDKVMWLTYNYAEPGVLFGDRFNTQNPLWFSETIRATNPCSEVNLPPYGACLLGSLNTSKYITEPFESDASFDWESFEKDVMVASVALNRVPEKGNLPVPQLMTELIKKRRHGLGITGLADAFIMLGIKYGSKESVELTERIMSKLYVNSMTAVDPFPPGDVDYDYIRINIGEKEALTKFAELQKHIKALINSDKFEDESATRHKLDIVLQAINMGAAEFKRSTPSDRDTPRYKNFMYLCTPFMKNLSADDFAKLAHHLMVSNLQWTHATSIAPTGTISLIMNNCSSGIEPVFSFKYIRNITNPDGTFTSNEVKDYALLAYEKFIRSKGGIFDIDKLPDYFVTAESISIDDHLNIMEAIQKYNDSSVSKTVNVPTDTSFDDFKDVYMKGFKKGLKGLTTFRMNENFTGGILLSDSELAKITYNIKLSDSEVITVKGNEMVEYKGIEHLAYNLYHYLKEGKLK